MADKGYVERLDTNKFEECRKTFEDGVESYNSIRTGVEEVTNSLMSNWQGDGKTQFEKDYNVIYRQLLDIQDILYDLRDSLVDAEATYISADHEYARQITGEN